MEPAVKKPKIYRYNSEWEKLYSCVEIGGQVTCLLCGQIFKYTKASNIKRHYLAQHAKPGEDSPSESEIHSLKIEAVKRKLEVDTNPPSLCNDNSTTGNLIPYRVAYLLAKHSKPVSDAETFKDLFPQVLKDIFINTQLEQRVCNFVDNLALSADTITQKKRSIAENIQSQLFEDLSRCDFFSLQLNESIDTRNHAQIVVFCRLVFPDLSVQEELLTIFVVKRRATATEIFHSLKVALSSARVSLEKLAAITTDRTVNPTSSDDDLITKCRKDPNFPQFNSFHCVLHQLALCCKEIKIEGILDSVMNIVNSIISEPTQDPLYNLFKEDNQSSVHGLSYYTEVKWLQKGNMLIRFYGNLTEIREFLKIRGQEYSQLNDCQWVNKLAYMVDLIDHMNYYIKKMQGNLKNFIHIAENIQSLKLLLENAVKGFKNNLLPFEFSRLRKIIDETEQTTSNTHYFADFTQGFLDHVNSRFIDMNETFDVLNFLKFPHGNHNIYGITQSMLASHPVNSTELLREIPNFQNDTRLRAIISMGCDMWPTIVAEKLYPNLLIIYKRISSFFTDTYLCESAFSHMTHIKSSERSLLTDDHLSEAMLISLSNYKPQLETLAEVVDSHSSQ